MMIKLVLNDISIVSYAHILELNRTRHKASEICLRSPFVIYTSHAFSRYCQETPNMIYTIMRIIDRAWPKSNQFCRWSGGRFKKTYELLNLRALKISPVNTIHIFQCMDKIFCVEFQRYPLQFHTKYLTHTLKDTIFIQHWNFKSS